MLLRTLAVAYFGRRSILALAVAAALISQSSQPARAEDNSKSKNDILRELYLGARKVIVAKLHLKEVATENDSLCSGEGYVSIIKSVSDFSDYVIYNINDKDNFLTASEKSHELQIVAAEYNGAAAIAARQGCKDLAHDTYIYVVEHFIGSDFQAARQRAQIGLDDLRAARP